jgi:hypothetical protein
MKLHLSWALLFLFLSPSALAGSIVKVNGAKVYIVFAADDSFAEGDLFVAVNPAGKKTGLILIEKVRGTKAIGLLQKGKAVAGSSTEFKGVAKNGTKKSKATAKSDDSSEAESSDGKKPNRARYGLMLGYGSATQDVKDTDPAHTAQTYSLTGTSNAIKGVYDHPLFDSVTLRFMAGGEIFSVSGKGFSGNIATDIKYLTLDMILKWDYYDSSSLRGYFIGGMGVFYPMSKSSTAIDSDTLTSFVIGEIGAGLEVKMGTYSIPLEVSYYYFPAGETVKTTVISVKTGVLF